jgi:hypothetical protein
MSDFAGDGHILKRITGFQGMHGLGDLSLIERSQHLAELWQRFAGKLAISIERRFSGEIWIAHWNDCILS